MTQVWLGLHGGTAQVDRDLVRMRGGTPASAWPSVLYTCIAARMVSAPHYPPRSCRFRASRPWVIAHRGASHALRENTVPAFREAFARGADAVEMDVRRPPTACLVVHHDAVVPDVGPIIGLDRDDLEEAAPWIPELTEPSPPAPGCG